MAENPDQLPAGATPTPSGSHDESASEAEQSISRDVLKAAYAAFKKRWKLTRLDYESRIGRGPLSAGSKSAIVGIEGPREYPRAVWDELVKQGRLKHAGSGLYAMP
jgi:hypothetical protein